MDKCDHEVVFFEADWAMKILARWHRCAQKNWFGLNGHSSHIGCAQRIVPTAFNDDGTPKEWKKEVTTYMSVVDDQSKQDAIVTAAIIKANFEDRLQKLEGDQKYLMSTTLFPSR